VIFVYRIPHIPFVHWILERDRKFIFFGEVTRYATEWYSVSPRSKGQRSKVHWEQKCKKNSHISWSKWVDLLQTKTEVITGPFYTYYRKHFNIGNASYLWYFYEIMSQRSPGRAPIETQVFAMVFSSSPHAKVWRNTSVPSEWWENSNYVGLAVSTQYCAVMYRRTVGRTDGITISNNVHYCILIILTLYTLCSEKNTHSHFLPYLHEWCVDLNKNCSEYKKGTVDSDHVRIEYSLRPMTSLWHHIWKRL